VLTRPKIRSTIRLYTVADKVVVGRDEREDVVIENPVFARLAPLCDGTRTLSEIMGELGASFSPPQIFFALDQLEKRGLAVEGEASHPRVDLTFIERFDPKLAEAAKRLDAFSVSLRRTGELPEVPLEEMIRANGLRLVEGSADLTVVLARDYLLPELEAINRAQLDAKAPWMLVKPVGLELWIGPIFRPGETGCWTCLAQRLSMNRQVETFMKRESGSDRPMMVSRAHVPASLELAASIAATEIERFALTPSTAPVLGKLMSFDVLSRTSRIHVLVKRPQCAACGSPEVFDPKTARVPELVARPKRYREEGGHRTATPEETYQRFQHHVSPILGVVTELTPIFGPKIPLIPTYIAGHNFAMGLHSLLFLRDSLRGSSGGKGVSDMQAKVSGLCEAIERYSGNHQGDEPSFVASYESIGEAAVHPNAVMGFSAAQIETRHVPHPVAPKSRCVRVPNPFDTTLPVQWTPVWSMTSGATRYVPSGLCYYGHPDFVRTLSMFPESNGSAAGTTFEDAFLQGFFELVERDAVALWFYNRVRRRAVDLDSFRLPYLDAIRDFYRSIHRDLWVIDISNDFPIATYACVSPRRDRAEEDIILGFGTHFDPQVALLRAVTEVNQFLPTLMPKNPDGSTRYMFGDQLAVHWWKTAKIAEHDYLTPADGPAVKKSDAPDLSKDDLRDDVNTAVQLCKERGMEVMVLDQTRPDIGLSVVKVFVPELCHFWRRLGKPRLFDLPAKMGWVEQRLTEKEANPYTIFF
jgi:oxazoline/thiazoline synthase